MPASFQPSKESRSPQILVKLFNCLILANCLNDHYCSQKILSTKLLLLQCFPELEPLQWGKTLLFLPLAAYSFVLSLRHI